MYKILFKLEQKKLNRLLENPKALVKFHLTKALNERWNFNYLRYFYISRKIIKLIFKKLKIFGIGIPSYYIFGSSKWQKLVSKNPYKLKLSVKKDSWFFFGIVISKKNWFLNSSLIIRNVFYNEIIEKTFFLFNERNILSQNININLTKQIFFKKRLKKKSTLFYLRSFPWVYSKVILL
jgi:ribosomal protein L19